MLGEGRGLVITNGYGLYVKLGRGRYGEVNRTGVRVGGVSSGFVPRPRWRLARVCNFVIEKDGLTCPRCGRYDNGYAMTGERSFCGEQRTRQQIVREVTRDA